MTRCHDFLNLLLLVYFISGAPTSASVSLPIDDTLSTYYCNDSPAWSGPSFFPKNCATALAHFLFEKQGVYEDMVFEFLAVNGRAQSRYPTQQTPQKFTYGTCTMAIVMLSAFQPGELPGVPPSRAFSPMDVASYNDVWNAVRQVMDNCISEYLAIDKTTPKIRGAINFRSQTGWGAFGSKGDIGVFLWDTNSEINEKIDADNLATDGLQSSYAPLLLLNLTQPETA